MWVPLGIMHPAGLSYINSTNPSSEILGETAAALAAGSIIFKDSNLDYSAKLLDHAKDLYNRATTNIGTYMKSTDPNFKTAKEWYPSSMFYDELAWGAAWLYVATNNQSYRDLADSWRHNASGHNNEVRTASG
jgi:endoglucanase